MNEEVNYSVSGESIRLRPTTEMKAWIFGKAAREHCTAPHVMLSLILKEMRQEHDLAVR